MSGKLPECFEMASKDLCSTTTAHAQNDLLNAWRKKDINEFLNILSSSECDPNFLYENDNYMRLLDSVVENGNVEFTEAILKAGADINLINPVRSKAPVHFAVESGQLEILKLLVARGADINIRDSTGSTILHYTVKQKWAPGEQKMRKCLEYLLQLDNLKVNLTNRKGLTAIHLATMQGSVDAVKMLLEKGSHLDLDFVRVGSAKRTARQEIVQKFPDLEKELPAPPDIYDIKMDGDKLFSLLHDNFEDRFCETFQEQIKDKAQKSLLKYSDGKYTFLQYCCEKKYAKAVKVLLENNADVNYAPNKTTRPILIACRKGDAEILRLLLAAKPDLSPNEDGENALHIVVKYTDNSEEHFNCLQILLRRLNKSNLDVNAQDLKGNTPLHYAVKYGGPSCVEELLKHGAYLGTLNKFKKPPLAEMSSSTLGNYLDHCITATDVLDRGNNYIMKFNYNFLVPKSNAVDPDLDDVKIPLTDEDETVNLKREIESVPESQPLLYMCKDSHLRKLLVHPVLTSFILLKWQRVRIFYYVNLIFYLLFCFLLTVYILFGYRGIEVVDVGNYEAIKKPDLNNSMRIAHDKLSGIVEKSTTEKMTVTTVRIDLESIHRNNSGDIEEILKESTAVDFLRVCLVIFLVILTLRELFQAVIHPKKYIIDPENWLEILLLVVLAFVLFKDCSREFPKSTRLGLWCPQFNALAILLSWFELVLLAGKHPLQSLHIEMFKTVSINFMKFLAWYVILIVAFALTFYTLFRGCGEECEENNPFVNPGLSIFKSIIMLTGEFDASDIPFVTFLGTSHVIFIAFIFLIAIVLLNLLNGLAVTDTQTIRNDSYLCRCIALVRLISYIENMLLVEADPFPCFNPFKCFGKKEKLLNLNCFEYLAKRIVFFPELLKDGVIYVLPNQRYKICFTDPKSINEEEPLCYNRLTDYYLDPSTAKTAERIVAERMAKKENPSLEMESLKKEMSFYGEKMSDMEKKMEALEQSTKQNEKLLIQILAILSLNNANNEDK
ncbi:hypothetical protein RUM43_006253 [Polyplax serrata]|uniref:Ion transport domain-containing protein n=1 Tax=Polyplax serrata TaxID=468196 RepID=A0AAN8NXZ4_POLSC